MNGCQKSNVQTHQDWDFSQYLERRERQGIDGQGNEKVSENRTECSEGEGWIAIQLAVASPVSSSSG